MAALDFPPSSESPFIAPNGVVYVWNDDGYWEADTSEVPTSDNTFLKLDASNDPITGNLSITGGLDVTTKVTAASTTDLDSDTTLVTKDYLNQTTDDATFWTESSGKLYPKTLTNNVGIGTGAANRKLTVKADSQFDGIHIIDNNGQNVAEVIGLEANGANGALVLWDGADKLVNIRANGSTNFNGGNVGIGTDSPARLLDLRAIDKDAVLRINNSGNGNRSAISFYRTTSAGDTKGGAGIWCESNTSSSGGVLAFGTASNADATSMTAKMVLDVNGNVGIGTDSPAEKLEVVSDTSTIVRVTSSDSGGSFLDLGKASSPTGGRIGYDPGNNLLFCTETTEKMRIRSDGRVGIGTDTPGAPLQVNDSSNTNPLTLQLTSDNSDSRLLLGNGSSGNSITNWNNKSVIEARDGEGLSIGVGDVKPITFYTDAGRDSRLTIVSGGNVGIGTNSPADILHLKKSTPVLVFQPTADSQAGRINFVNTAGQFKGRIGYEYSDDALQFITNAFERMRIDSGGRLLIGTSAVTNYAGGASGLLQVVGTTNAHIALQRSTNNTSQPTFSFSKSRGDVATPSKVLNGDYLGTIRFSGYDGADYTSTAAEINCVADGSISTGTVPGRLVFSTTADGASNPTERMRIRSDGNVSLGDGGNGYQKLAINGSFPTAGVNKTEIFSARGNFRETVGNAYVFYSRPNVNLSASAETIGALSHFVADARNTLTQGNLTTQYGFVCGSSLTAATNNYGFYSNIAVSPNRWNFFAAGTAANYFAGNVLFNTANESGITGGSASGISVGTDTVIRFSKPGSDDHQFIQFRRNSSSTPVGVIECSATGTSYTETSDYRLKENIAPLTGAVDQLKALKPCVYNFKTDPDTTLQGFIAHEAQEVCPQAVTGTKDATEAIGTLFDWDGTVREQDVIEPKELTYSEEVVTTPAVEAADATYDEEGEELTPAVEAVEEVRETVTREMTWEKTADRDVMQGIDKSKLVPLLTAALQEALAEIDALKGRLDAAGI